MKILITGVAGFIGSNLALALLERGYTVVGMDNMSQGHELNMADFIHHPRFTMLREDVRDATAVNRAMEGCNAVVHLAAYKIPRYSDALDTLLINSIGSHNVLEAAIKHKCRVLSASTSDVYGKNPNVPFREDSDLVIGNPTIKRWAYAISKVFDEQLHFAYHDRHGLEFVILRFFGGYGPNQNLTWWGGPQSVFINAALEEREIEIHGDGQQTRSFTYVSDHVDGIMRCIENPAAVNRVFNLGAVEEITIEGLGRLIWRLVRGDDPPKLKFIPYTAFGNYEDVRRRVPDISLARQLLGYEPQVDLESGLQRTIVWQIQRRAQLKL
ncbi:MAG: NAD-dependent epimerase/dehydratase family protein [Anaerolineae bacterium]|nr:NAD-dependent epimerase/dehydratase family protein [Anaerolineae bacterium]